ncbi:MAG: TolC family protein, partial [Verrucomicrobiales bacterium]
ALRLDTLMGVPAGSGEAPRGRLRDLDVPAPPAAAPSEFLARRPDVAAAEARVRAAFDIARAAKLDLFPNLSLKLGGSLEAGALTGPAKSWIATAGPLLSIPVFDPARLAEVRQSDAEAAVAAEAYRAAALRAFEEAEGAMLSLQSRRRQAQRAAATAAKLAEVRKRTGDRFAEGLVSQLEVLEDERQSLDAQRAALQSREAALADAAAVFKAMGGGFR